MGAGCRPQFDTATGQSVKNLGLPDPFRQIRAHAMTKQNHFLALDALRGVAAVSVMLFHISNGWLPCGYLAVDMFFMLSGFVLAFSYEDRLRNRMSFREFLLRRLIRLYPMIIAGSVAGLFSSIGRYELYHHHIPAHSYIASFLYSLIILPQISVTPFGSQIFPLNTVIWSLFFELIANILYGLFLFKSRLPVLMVIVGSSLIAIVLIGPVGGYETQNFWAGFPRVGFDFFGGVILYKIYLSNRLPHWRIGPITLSIALFAIFSIPTAIDGLMLIPILFSFSFIIYSAAHIDKIQKYNSIQNLLGAISYPLYALHRPLFAVCLFLLLKLGVDMDRQYPIIVFLSSIMIFAGSYFVLKLYDEPLRAYLSRKLLKAKATSVKSESKIASVVKSLADP